MGDSNETILAPAEIEAYIDSLEPILIPDIGSPRWNSQRERLYQLSLQAAWDAKSDREEMIMETLVSHGKANVLIHELIATELWRLKVLPLILDTEADIKSCVPLYIVLYHEAAILTFLEAVMYHEQVMESVEDCLIDLADYCYRNAVSLTSVESDNDKCSTDVSSSEKERLVEQNNEIRFECRMKCVSILSFMAHNVKTLPLSVLHRFLVVHDIPVFFAKLMECLPWKRDGKDGRQVFDDGRWKKVNPNEIFKVTKIEGQIWISFVQLLLAPDSRNKYDISGYKKDQLLKLRSHLNQVLFDQIPILVELLRYLEQLSLFDAPVPQSIVMIEQEADIWECLQKEYKNKWHAIAKTQYRKYFSPNEAELQSLCKGLVKSFDLENIEAMLPDPPACAQCRSKGLKRCSRCKNEWYCGRKCQISHWPIHQISCDLMASQIN